jgi:CRISPR-associated protein Cas2
MLQSSGGIRLQMSVFEFDNTKRILDNLKVKIETQFAKKFEMSDSVFIFETDGEKSIKYGNSIHRDKDIIFL